jgi:hypothetical protein
MKKVITDMQNLINKINRELTLPFEAAVASAYESLSPVKVGFSITVTASKSAIPRFKRIFSNINFVLSSFKVAI